MRIVLDTNVIVSGVAYPGSVPGRIVKGWRQSRWQLVASQYILDEVVRVLPRVLRSRFADNQIQELIEKLTENMAFSADIVELPDPGRTVDRRLRDSNDQAVLQTLLVGKAEYLVTGDKDLLVLSHLYPILSPAEFWQRCGAGLN